MLQIFSSPYTELCELFPTLGIHTPLLLLLKTKQNKTKLDEIFLTGIFHKTRKTIKKKYCHQFHFRQHISPEERT